MAKKNIAGFIRAKTLEMRDRVAERPNYREVWSFRGLWYWIKPFLYAYEEKTIEETGWARKRSQQLSSVVSDMVLDKVLTYKDILVEDQDRVMNISGWPEYYKDVIVFVEKNNVYHMVKSVADIFDISIVAGKGFAATSSIEKMIDRLDINQDYKIILLTDYDPFGAYIGEEFCSRCKIMGLKVEVIHAGLKLEQIPEENRDTSKYPVSKGKLPEEFYNAWIKANPLDNWGFELECFTAFMDRDAEHLRTILVDCLLEHCPEKVMYDALLEGAKDNVTEEATNEVIDELPFYKELQDKIDELKEKRDDFYNKAHEIVSPVAETELEELDDERKIPEGTLRKQAIAGNGMLLHYEWTNADDLKKQLCDKLNEMINDEEIDLADATPE